MHPDREGASGLTSFLRCCPCVTNLLPLRSSLVPASASS